MDANEHHREKLGLMGLLLAVGVFGHNKELKYNFEVITAIWRRLITPNTKSHAKTQWIKTLQKRKHLYFFNVG